VLGLGASDIVTTRQNFRKTSHRYRRTDNIKIQKPQYRGEKHLYKRLVPVLNMKMKHLFSRNISLARRQTVT
jgi:hypothetical protein